MKKLQFLLGVALGGAMLSAGLSAAAATSKPGYATVVRVKGDAAYSLDGGTNTHPLVPGKYLDPGARIITGYDGEVDVVLGKQIEFPQATWQPERIGPSVDSPVTWFSSYKPSAEQNIVRVLSKSTLIINKLTTTSRYSDSVTDTELELTKGSSIYASVKKFNTAADQYVIKTPKGIAGVKGTQFSMEIDINGNIKRVAVYKVQDPSGGIMVSEPPTPVITLVGGQMWEPGDPGPVPVPPSLMKYYQLTYSSVRTVYFQLVSYNYDITKVLTSSDYGAY
jgi:hypothetical protein